MSYDIGMAADIADYHWLTSDDALPLLHDLQLRLSAAGQVDVRLAASLRKSHSATRTHLLLEQVELRGRARDKFTDPSELFFTRKGLEQCTDEWLANYKAQRFPVGDGVADICCGIGGDALALARHRRLTAWDADPVAAHFAACNLKNRGFEQAAVNARSANIAAVEGVAAWHIDPDRRAAGERIIQMDHYEPGPDFLRQLLRANPQGSIKIAPAADVAAAVWPDCEREWLGSRGECRQQVLWFGRLCRQAGKHVATLVDRQGQAFSYAGDADVAFVHAAQIQANLYEPDATILAAQLAGAFAAQFELEAVTAGGGYLTSQRLVSHPLMEAFRVRDVLPYDLRKLKSYCREHRLGQLEIKKRGVDLQPHFVRRQIIGVGDEAAVIFIAQAGGSVKAIVTDRLR